MTAAAPNQFRIIIFAAIIIIAGLFVAAPAFHGTWLMGDDQQISANTAVQGAYGSLNGLKDIWIPGRVGADYVPVKTTFLWLEWRLFNAIGLRHDTAPPSSEYHGNINIGYHVVNALIHLLNALLVWNLFYRLKIKWAWLGGLLFAIHPVLVESVAWITEQKNTLSLVFMLLSMISFINFDERRRASDIIASLALFLAALLSKPTVVMLPCCLLLYIWWKRGRLAPRDIAYTAPYFLLSVIIGAMTMYFMAARSIGAEIIPVGGPLSRIATAGMAVWFYLWKSVWPSGLLPIYPRWDVARPSFAQLILPWLAMAAVLAACVYNMYKRKTWGRHVILGLGFFLGNLVPALGFVTFSDMRLTWVANYYMYISLIGVIGLAVAGAAALSEKNQSKGKPFALLAGVVVLALLAWNAHIYSSRFVSETAMWQYTLAKNPDAWLAHSRYGKILLDHGNVDDSFYHIEQSNLLRPDLAETNNNMGVLLLQKKRGPEALPYFKRAVELMPIGAFIFNYANALTQQGHGAEAAPVYEKLIRMNGNDTLAKILRAEGFSASDIGTGAADAAGVNCLYELIAKTKAGAEATAAGAPNLTAQKLAAQGISDPSLVLTNYAAALMQAGRRDDAIRAYQHALMIREIPDAMVNYAMVLTQSGRGKEALPIFEKLMRVETYAGNANILAHYGLALFQSGRKPDAIRVLEHALQLNPDRPDVRRNLDMMKNASDAPKGQSIPAQGNALGIRSYNIPSPERASQSIHIWNAWDAPSGLGFAFIQKPRALPWAGMEQAVGLPNQCDFHFPSYSASLSPSLSLPLSHHSQLQPQDADDISTTDFS